MESHRPAKRRDFFASRSSVLPAGIFLFSFFISLTFLWRPFSAAEKERSPVMKGIMFDVLILVSDLDSHKGDEPVNWKSVQGKIGELDRKVAVIRSLDTGGTYDLPLRELRQALAAMNRLAAGEDPRAFDRLEGVKQKCFECHSAHVAGPR